MLARDFDAAEHQGDPEMKIKEQPAKNRANKRKFQNHLKIGGFIWNGNNRLAIRNSLQLTQSHLQLLKRKMLQDFEGRDQIKAIIREGEFADIRHHVRIK